MAFGIVLAGPAQAVQRARAELAFPSLAVALVGEGDLAEAPIAARASCWAEFDASACAARTIILAEAPSPIEMRAIFRNFSDLKKIQMWDQGALRPLRLEDFVSRPRSPIEASHLAKAVQGKRVLVTGGGGSIGAELVRKIAALSPAHLTALDNSEFNLFKIGVEQPNASLALADIRDGAALQRLIEAIQPDLVFHAAALKHVPMAESFPCEAVLTNLHGLRNVAESAQSAGADLVLVSTDKAVDPTGVMGATKRLGELYVRALDLRGEKRAIAVRLGNVIGSAGSVVPLFETQIAARAPLTVTDPDATRYFMSIANAAEALLQCASAGLARDSARGLVLSVDMGEPLSVMELAQLTIRLAGLCPERDVEINVTGLRPGERPHEFFIGADEWRHSSSVDGMLAIAAPPISFSSVQDVADNLVELARKGRDDDLRQALFAAVAPASVRTANRAYA